MTDFDKLAARFAPLDTPGQPAAPAPGETNFDALAARFAPRPSDNLGAALVASRGTDPAIAAQRRKNAIALGVQESLLTGSKTEVDDIAYQKHTAENLVKDSPKTADFLALGTNAEIVGRDIPGLAGLELAAGGANLGKQKILRSYLGASTASGVHSVLGASANLLDAIQPFTTSQQDAAVLFRDKPDELRKFRDESASGFLARFARGQQAAADSYVKNISPEAQAEYGSLKYATLDLSEAAYLSPVKVVGDVIQSLPSTAVLILAGVFTRGVAKSAYADALAGGLTPEAAKIVATKAAAQHMAVTSAVGEGGVGYGQQKGQTEAAAEKSLAKSTANSPEYQRLIEQGYAPYSAVRLLVAQAAEESALYAGAVDAATNLVGGRYLGKLIGEGGSLVPRTLKGFAAEGLTEGVQSGGEQLGQNVALRSHVNAGQDLSDGVAESIVQGFVIGGVTGGGFGAVFARNQEGQAKIDTSTDTLGQVKALAEASRDNPVLARSPEVFHDFVTQITEEGASEVFVDGKTLRDVFAQSGVSPEEIQRKLPEVAAQLDDAVGATHDVRISTADLLTHITDPKIQEALLPHIKDAPNGLTFAQLETALPALKAENEQRIEKMLTEVAKEDALQADIATVRDSLVADLGATGRFTERVTRDQVQPIVDFIATTARAQGVTPSAFYAENRLNIQGARLTGAPLKQAARTYTRADVEALDYDGAQAMLKETGGVRPAWLPEGADAYVQEYGERAYQDKTAAEGYAKALELGEGGTWEVAKQGQSWRAKRVPETKVREENDAYQTDVFGQSLPDSPGAVPGATRSGATAVSREAAAAVYATRTELVQEGTRELGAEKVNSIAEAAQALAYLNKGAVERFDALVTDAEGNPLAIVGSFKGAIAETSVYPATILGEAFRVPGAANIWFAHNHPDGKAELSAADRFISGHLTDVFTGSGITPRGFLAMASKKAGVQAWVAEGVKGEGDIYGAVDTPASTTTVSSFERQFTENGALGPSIDSPAVARSAAIELSAGQSGVLMLNTQNDPVGFLPIPAGGLVPLRGTGRMDALYRALSISNAFRTMIVGQQDAFSKLGIENLAGFLNRAGAKVLDVLEVKDEGVVSWAERGFIFERSTFAQTPARNPDTTGAAAVVKAQADAYVAEHLEEAKARYVEANTNAAGVLVVDTDSARELFPAYVANRARFASAVHEAASKVATAVYQDAVKAEVKSGRVPVVVFTGGGTGSGKSSVRGVAGDSIDTVHLIRDTTLANFDKSVVSIDQALASGKSVRIYHVMRDPIVSLVEGSLPRAMQSGRTVNLLAHAAAHEQANATARRLLDHYAGNPDVEILIVDNRGAKDEAHFAGVDILADANYTDQVPRLIQALNTEYLNGKISQEVYEATLGTLQLQRVGEEGGQGVFGAAEQDNAGGARGVPGVFAQSAFYSALEREIPALLNIADKNGRVAAAQAKAWIAARQKEGKFKLAEIEALGMYEWLAIAEQEGKIPVADIVEFVANNGVQVEDVMLSGEEVDEDLYISIGQFETEEPDAEYLSEVASESYLEDAKQDIADENEIALEDVNEDEARTLAYERAERDYWEDGDAPQHADASVDFGGRSYTYSVEYRYGETEIYSHDQHDVVYQGRSLDHREIEARIRDDVRENTVASAGEGGPTKFSDWRLEGGDDYRELLLTLPNNEKTYAGPHFDQANIAAHVRFDTREGPNGEKVLFIQEIQSDWGQQGKKKGFRQQTYTKADVKILRAGDERSMAPDSMWYVEVPGNVYQFSKALVPDESAAVQRAVDKLNFDTGDIALAPFVTNTKEWTALAVKRMLRYAAENSFDSISWTTGQQQADRYSLSKHIGKLKYEGEMLRAYAPNGDNVWSQVVSEDEIADFVGKETADKLLAQPDTNPANNIQESSYAIRELSGLDLEVGGEGMKGYYDKIVPQVTNDVLKKLGVAERVAAVAFELREPSDPKFGPDGEPYDLTTAQPGFKITPELKAKVLQGLPLFQDNNAEFDPTTLTATFLKGANLSSVQHEAAHYYLEVLTRIAAQPNAPERIVKDVATTLEWFGIKGATPEERLTNWRAMSINERRDYDEQWAESHERWMLEGKAPAVEMQPLFSRFRAWFLQVYKSMEQFLQQNPRAGKLNDEVRAIFGRLIAAEDAITYAEETRGYSALFENEQAAGVSPKTFEAYVRLGDDATRDAVTNMQNASLRDVRWLSNAKDKHIRALQGEARALRKEIKDEVTKEVMAEPINLARTWLTTGETTDPATGEQVKVLQGYKLDSAALKEMYPATALSNPDLTKLRGLTSAEGLHPDAVAQMFGFSSGDALVRELIDGEKAKDKIDGLTDARMLEEHGELVDARAIELAAEAAIHNDARARFLATGLKLLSKSPVPARQLAKAAKLAAETAIAGKKVRELRPGQYTAAEARANKTALKLAAKDPKGAIDAQKSALLNNQLARASANAVEEVQQLVRYLKKFEGAGTRKNVDIEYLDQVDALLKPFDIKTGISLKEIDRRTSLIAWVDAQEAQGFQPAIDAEAIELAKQKSYKDMTVEELRGFAEAIAQVEHIGRLKKKLLTAKDKREFATRIAEAEASIVANANRTVTERGTPSDVAGQLGLWVRQLAAAHRKFSSFMREMDGSRDGGVMWELMSRGMNEAGDKETRMRAEATKALAEVFNPVQKTINAESGVANILSRKRVVPGTDISMTHEQRLMFAMNWGNEGNRQRLLDGGMPGKRALSEGEARLVLDTLTHEEWNFVQAMLDYVGSYRDQIAEQERQLTGIEPKWIEAAPIQTKFGTFAGGYFPAKYDVLLSTRSDALESVTDLRQAMKGAFGAAAARNGYAKARADAVVGRPLHLSFDVISRHVNEVIHRLSWQAWLTDTNRVLRALDGPIRDHYGVEVLKELQDTMAGIAVGDTPATSPLERGLNHLRIGSTISGLGWRVMTALQQPSGLAQSWSRIGGGWMARGVAAFARGPLEAGAFVNSKSSLMRDRGTTMQREINEVLNTVRAGETNDAVRGSFFTLIGKMQRVVDIPTWLGAYEKANAQLGLENAGSEEERTAIDEKAVALADQAVIDSQSGGQFKDLAKIQRGSPALKLFTNFYSYFSATYNLNVEAYRRTNFTSPSEVGLFAVDVLLLNSAPVLFSFALKELLKGSCEDDIECLAEKLGQEQAGFLFGQMIPLREVGAAVTIATGGPSYGYSGPAGLRFFNDVYKLTQQAKQGEADAAFWKAANNVGGALLHYPAGQINATVEGVVAVENGEVKGAAVLPAILVGPPKK